MTYPDLYHLAETGRLAFPADIAPHIHCPDLGRAILLSRDFGRVLARHTNSPVMQSEAQRVRKSLELMREVAERWLEVEERETAWTEEFRQRLDREA